MKEGSYSRRISYAIAFYLYSQIKASLISRQEVAPDGKEAAHEAGAFGRKALTDS